MSRAAESDVAPSTASNTATQGNDSTLRQRRTVLADKSGDALSDGTTEEGVQKEEPSFGKTPAGIGTSPSVV
jgi:hypothetical protein